MEDNAELSILGETKVGVGTYIKIHKTAKMTIGGAAINWDCVFVIEKELEIGKDVLMGRLVTILDSDYHPVFDAQGVRKNPPVKVSIANHTWIGLKATILKGTKIKEGAVVSAGSLVSGIVKAGRLYSIYPAEDFGAISWRG